MKFLRSDGNELPTDPAEWDSAHIMLICIDKLIDEKIVPPDFQNWIGEPARAEPIKEVDGSFLDDNSFYVPFHDPRALEVLYDNNHLAFARLEELFESKLYFITAGGGMQDGVQFAN